MFVRGFVRRLCLRTMADGDAETVVCGDFCRAVEMVCTERIYAHIQYDMRFVRDFFGLIFCQTGKYGYICSRFSRNQPGWRNR